MNDDGYIYHSPCSDYQWKVKTSVIDVASDLRVPIVVGVTGHRDLHPDDVVGLEAKVREFYRRLRSTYSNTPVVTLSPLCEGADRLVAKVALEQGSSVIVPLPMPEHEYEDDFETEVSKVEFRELLAQAQASFIVSSTRDTASADANTPQPDREQAYLSLGMFIARHSHILLALWDGADSGRTGGTSQTVGFRLDGLPEPFGPVCSALDKIDDGPVYHIVARRMDSSSLGMTPLSVNELYSGAAQNDAAAKDRFDSVLRRTDNYNRDVLSARLDYGKIDESKSRLLPQDKQRSVPVSAAGILDAYGMADVLADLYQTRMRGSLGLLLSLVLLAYFLFQVYLDFLQKPGILVLYPLALSTAYGWYLFIKRRDYQDKHLDYRALAEGLRTQFYWLLSGLDDDVADYYLRKHTGDLEWVRRAIRVRNLFCKIATRDDESCSLGRSGLEIVLSRWVDGQLHYYVDAASRDANRLGRQQKTANWFFATALGLVLAMLVLDVLQTDAQGSWRRFLELIHPYLVMLVSMQLAVAAAIGGFVEKMAFGEHAKQYALMHPLFDRASAHLESLLSKDDIVGARRLIKELGLELLAENGDWVVLHRSKPIAVAKG